MQKNITKSEVSIPALFIYYEGALDDVPGGVQLCSKEYYQSLEHAGFSLETLKVENDRRMSNRVKRKPVPNLTDMLLTRKKLLRILKTNFQNR